ALLSEHEPPVGVGVGVIGRDLQGALIVVDGVGQLPLLSESATQVVVGVGIVRLDVDGLPVVLDRFSWLALLSESVAEVILGNRRVRVDSEGMSPKGLRVMPDLDLVPGESSQADGDKDNEPDQKER